MPVVSCSVNRYRYQVLEELAKREGITISKVVKKVIESYIDALINNANIYTLINNKQLIMPHYISGINNKALIIRNIDSSKVGNGEEKSPQQDLHNKNFATGVSNIDVLSEGGSDPEDLEKVLREIRKLGDLINMYTGKNDQVLQRLSQLVEALESLNEKLGRVVELLSKQQDLAKLSEERQKASEERSVKEGGREKHDKCEILRKELAVFESEIGAKIRNRDKFFASLERDCEAVVIECARERVAVEKGFWLSFLDKLSKIDTADDDKIKTLLGLPEFKLFKVLKESALLYFSASEKRWALAGGIGIVSSTTRTGTSAESSTTTHGNSTSKQRSHTKKLHYRKSYEDDESWLLQYADIE
jgi:hypothetical protein